MNTQIDISGVLSSVRTPSLVLHRTGDRDANVEEGKFIADKIPDAQFIELPGDDHFPFVGDQDRVADEVQNFLTGEVAARPVTRVLTSIIITDIVSSTKTAGDLGDTAWRELLNRHDHMCRTTINRFKGGNFKSTGDGELSVDEVAGIAVHLGARVSAQATGGELLVSRTVRDLVAGSDYQFSHRGDFELKGFEEKWALFAME